MCCRLLRSEIPEVNLRRIIVTFYGDPAEKQAEIKQHKQEAELRNSTKKGVANPQVERERPGAQVPFFTNPTACSERAAGRDDLDGLLGASRAASTRPTA